MSDWQNIISNITVILKVSKVILKISKVILNVSKVMLNVSKVILKVCKVILKTPLYLVTSALYYAVTVSFTSKNTYRLLSYGKWYKQFMSAAYSNSKCASFC